MRPNIVQEILEKTKIIGATDTKSVHSNLFRPNPGLREKNNLDFHTSLWCLKTPLMPS